MVLIVIWEVVPSSWLNESSLFKLPSSQNPHALCEGGSTPPPPFPLKLPVQTGTSRFLSDLPGQAPTGPIRWLISNQNEYPHNHQLPTSRECPGSAPWHPDYPLGARSQGAEPTQPPRTGVQFPRLLGGRQAEAAGFPGMRSHPQTAVPAKQLAGRASLNKKLAPWDSPVTHLFVILSSHSLNC